MKIIGFSRVRNEELLIADTVRHMEQHCDGLVFLDDSSSDGTVREIERVQTKVLAIVKSPHWELDRVAEETRHRKLLYAVAREFDPDWLFCFDADERFVGDVRQVLHSPAMENADGVRVQLFDAYLSEQAQSAYVAEMRLEDVDRMYGPERRDILMLWRNSDKFFYEGMDRREPVATSDARIVTGPIYCKHFGKAVSVGQWEEACEYYATHFPEPYASKWTARRGKAIHTMSDFGTPLYGWDQVHQHAVRIHPFEPVAADSRSFIGRARVFAIAQPWAGKVKALLARK